MQVSHCVQKRSFLVKWCMRHTFDRFSPYFLGQCGRPGNNELWSQHCRFCPPFGHPCRSPGCQVRRPRPPSSMCRCECLESYDGWSSCHICFRLSHSLIRILYLAGFSLEMWVPFRQSGECTDRWSQLSRLLWYLGRSWGARGDRTESRTLEQSMSTTLVLSLAEWNSFLFIASFLGI